MIEPVPQLQRPAVKRLDVEVVGVLRALDADGTLLPRLSDAYRRDARRLVAEIATGAHARQAEQIGKAAHGLRGASMSLGLIGLAAACLELEALARARRFELISPHLQQLEREIEAALDALEAA